MESKVKYMAGTGAVMTDASDGNSLFEVHVLSVLSSNQLSKGHVISLVRSQLVCVSTGNVLQILTLSDPYSSNEEEERPPSVFEFEFPIDAIGWTADETLLVAGDRHGVIHFVNPYLQQVLFSQDVRAQACIEGESSEKTFLSIQFLHSSRGLEPGKSSLLLLCSTGIVLVFQNLPLDKLAVCQNDVQFIAQLKNEIKLTKLDLSTEHDIYSSFLLPLTTPTRYNTGVMISSGRGKSGLCVWGLNSEDELEVRDSISYILQGTGIIRCDVTRDGQYLVTLSESETLAVWMLSSLVMINLWTPGKVKDFSLCLVGTAGGSINSQRGNANRRGCSDRLCVITEDSTEKRCLVIATLPGLGPVYSIEVSASACLFQGTITEDSMYFIDAGGVNENEQTLQVKHLIQALPENRLATLLAQEKFLEAELLAKKFNLDAELVYKTKARVFNTLWINKTIAGEDVTDIHSNLLQCLNLVQDTLFTANLVLESPYPNVDMTVEGLHVAKKKLKKFTGSVKSKVLTALNKLVTYQMIHSDDCFCPHLWQSFLAGSLLDEIRKRLQTGDLKNSEIIWNRHLGQLVVEIGDTELQLLVRCIPESVPSAELGVWLSHSIIPFILQHRTQSLGEFLLWTQERVRLLELTEKDHWPRNGLQLCDRVLEAVSSFRNPMAKMALQAHALSLKNSLDGEQSSLCLLKSLQQRLNDICYVHSTLQCPLTLAEHEKESRETVVFRLLDKVVAAELVTTTIEHKVVPYVDKHKLNLDSVLLNYIKLFLSQSPRFSTHLTDSPYEAKAIALVQAVNDKEIYVSGCIELLKYVHTPWSGTVEELVQECLKVDLPCVATLEKQYKLLQLKKLLHSYGIRNVNFSDASYRWLYIRHMLSNSGPTVLEDALQVASMYQLSVPDVYKYHIINLGAKDRIDVAKEVLRALPEVDRITTAQKTFEFMSSKLQLPFDPNLDDPGEYSAAAKLTLLCLATFRESQNEDSECCLYEDWISIETVTSLYERLLALQVEYSMFLSPRQLSDRRKCVELFEAKVQEFTRQLCTSQSSHSKKYHSATRYCYLLGFSEKCFFEAVAMNCAREKNMKQAKELCWELVKDSPETCPAYLLLCTVQHGWALIKSNPETASKKDIEDLRSLAAQAVTICSSGRLLDALEMYSLCSLLLALHSQCEGPGIEEVEGDTRGSEFTEWSWSPRFKEDGLVLDQRTILPAAIKFAESMVPSVSGTNTGVVSAAYSSCSSAMQPVLKLSYQLRQMLQENGHNQLSLLCSLQSLSSHCQHTAVIAVGDQTSPCQCGDESYPVLKQGQEDISNLVVGLVGKVLSSRRLDHDYALSLLLLVTPHHAAQKLQGIRSKSISSYSRVISLCDLAVDYSHLTRQSSLKEQTLNIRASANWGKRLSTVKISYTEAFRGGQEEKKQVATALFKNKMVDVETILQYCDEVLGHSPQSVLLTYLRVVLTEWEESRQSLERAADILPQINSHKLVQELLVSLLSTKVSPYDYEQIDFILQHLVGGEQADTLKVDQGVLLLKCLKCYTRSTPPSDCEREWFVQNRVQLPTSAPEPSLSEVQLPTQSSSRLPFHPILYATPMEIVGQELSEATIAKLEPIATILKLNGDDFYSVAIKNIASLSGDGHVSKGSSPKAALTTVQFSSVTDLLRRIQNVNLALSITKWLAKQLQTDDERVVALKTAVSIALKWKENAHTETELMSANEKLSMFTKLLRITQTDQLLHLYKLDEPDFLKFSNQGARLIMQLFTEVPVSKRQPIPAVHSLATEIAQVNRINLDKIKTKLTEQWLLSTKADSRDMDVTQMSMLEDPTEDCYGADGESEDELNFKRLKYLLNVPEKLEANSSMLLHWAKRTSSSTGSLSRVKALQVLFAVSSDSVIEKISGTSSNEVREFMQGALFTSELERLHMSTTVSAFQACNKEGLVKSLWRNHAQEPRALRLICELCLHYAISDSSLWSKLLQQLLSLGMLPYLRHVLRTLISNPDQLWNIPSLPGVWQETLLYPFQDATPPLSLFQEEECTQTLRMLLGCPFPFELDISQITTGFFGVGLIAHALVAVLVVPTGEQRQGLVKNLLEKMTRKQIDTFLSELSDPTKNYALVNYRQQIQELVYLYVNWSGRHEVLVGSQQFTSYVHFLVSRKLIDGLLIKTLQANKVAEAIKLVELYSRYHKLSSQSGMDLLKEYLALKNILDFKETLELMSDQ